MNAHDRRSRTRRRSALAALTLTCAVILSGCGVRLETPPPTEPVPDAAEVIRRTAVADALLVAEQAEEASAADTVRQDVAAELTRVADAATVQAEQLGGEYDSGLGDIVVEEPDSSPSTTSPEHTPRAVVTSLSDAAARTRAAANQTQVGPLARLLASISASQTQHATALARLTGAKGPDLLSTQIPEPDDSGTEPSGASADASPAAAAATQEPPTVPTGLSIEELSALVAAEDSTAYALEVRAAQADGDARTRTAERAKVHRERAQGWALVAEIDGTDQDPRRVAYSVPGADTPTAELARDLETSLATDYATLVGAAEPGSRSILVALLTDSTMATTAAAPFPGLPEHD